MSSSSPQPVLVVGATGYLGSRVVARLMDNGHPVRALVRPTTDPAKLSQQFPGIEIVRGDMNDPKSLENAFQGTSAVVATAAGYMQRQKGDSLKTDVDGNRNLVDAAKKAGTGVFVFCSILTCDQASDVPHFHAKALTENYLQEQKVPSVILRPGAFLQPDVFPTLKRGFIMSMWEPKAKLTYVYPVDVANALADAVDKPTAVGKIIDIGTDRAVSNEELASVMTNVLKQNGENKSISVVRLPRFVMAGVSWFSTFMGDMLSMSDYFNRGNYVANTSLQAKFFKVRTVEEGAKNLLEEVGVLSKQNQQSS